MAFPATIDSPDTSMQGTTLFTGDDHSLQHRTVGSAVIAIETFLGTNSATNIFGGFTSGQQILPIQSGTLGTIIAKGTINNSVFGSPTVTNGTFSTPIITGGVSFLNNGSITQTGVADNITLTPGASKVVKSQEVVSDNGTVSYIVGYPQYGWGTLVVNSGTNFGTGTTTFPISYGTIKSVLISLIGLSLGTPPTGISTFTESLVGNGLLVSLSPDTVGTSGFHVSLLTSGTAGTITYYGYSWMAYGQ